MYDQVNSSRDKPTTYSCILRQIFERLLIRSCTSQKAFGTNYGLTAKVPKDAFKITSGTTKEHVGDNGSGHLLHREFCDNCGSYILEYGVSIHTSGRGRSAHEFFPILVR